MACPENAHLHAYIDGEVDAISAADIERHLRECGQCRSLCEELEHMRIAIRQDVRPERAPASLRARIGQSLGREAGSAARAPSGRRPRSTFAWLMSAGLGGAAVAGALIFFFGTLRNDSVVLDELVSAHVRSLMPAHLIDVESSDHHTVKPWFAGRTDVSPVVVDFGSQGYPLLGGRADYLDRHRVAVLVYRHDRHLINVFNWPAGDASLPSLTTRDGYHVSCWVNGDVQACAVSDTGSHELEALVKLLQDSGASGR